MGVKSRYGDQNQLFFFNQAVGMLDILTWSSLETDSVLEAAPSGQSENCSFSYFRVGLDVNAAACLSEARSTLNGRGQLSSDSNYHT